MKGTRQSLLLTFAVLVPMHAVASPFTVQAVAHALTANGVDHQDSGVLINTPAHEVAGSSDNFAGATAGSTATPAKLGAFAGTTSLSGAFGGATANALAAFSDSLTLFSDTPGFTGPITLAFTFAIDGSLDGCAACPAQGSVSSAFSVSGVGTFLGNRSTLNYAQAFVGGLLNVSSNPGPTSIQFTTTIDQEIALMGSLNVFAGADGIGSHSSANFANTATFYVSVLTPGVTFQSASGATYSAAPTAVPEPSTLLLVPSVVLVPLWGMLKRQRRASSAVR